MIIYTNWVGTGIPFLLAESSGVISNTVWNRDSLSWLSWVWLSPLDDHIKLPLNPRPLLLIR